MQDVFYNIVDISIASVWLIVAVVVLRAVLQKSPKWTRIVMWLIVAVRLVFPFRLESEIGVVPQVNIDGITTPEISATEIPIPETPPVVPNIIEPPKISVSEILCTVWLVGIAAMMAYLIISYLKLKKRVDVSITLDSRYRICDSIQTPFIFGIIKPKVYLPSVIGEAQLQYVMDHENSHLKYGDHIWKLLGFILLSVHWFNPLVWLAYFLFCKDIELWCDERVVSGKDAEYKRQYSAALLVCSTTNKEFSACPVAFGEISVKSRIANIVKYKKPAFILVAVSVAATISLLLLFLRAPLVLAENNIVIPNNANNSSNNSVSAPTRNETEVPKSEGTVSQINPSVIIDVPEIEAKCTHTYKNTKVAGNCFTEGYTVHECTKCGFVYMDEYNGGRHDYGKYNCLVCGMADPRYALYGFRGWVKEYGQESGNFYVYNFQQGDEIYGVQRHKSIEEYCVLTYDNVAGQEHIYITFYDTSYCNVYYEWGKYSGFAEIKNSGVNSVTGIVFDDFTGDDAARVEFTDRYQSIIDNVMRNIEDNIVEAKIGITLNSLGFSKY